MERVVTLSDRLKEQITSGATIADLLVTVQMLDAELRHIQSTATQPQPGFSVALDIPTALTSEQILPLEQKIYLPLEVDETLLQEELEQIRRSAEAINSISIKNRRALRFDPVEDIPTLTHQTAAPMTAELNETLSASISETLNEKLRESRKELSEALKDTPLQDLRKAIGVNDRFQFIRDLFQGDEDLFEKSVRTINAFSIYPEAEYWIRRELRTKLGWDNKNETVRLFDQLVKRRFSAT